MPLKWKIYICVAIVIIGIIAYQAFAIHNLRNELHNSTLTISTLKQNELALKDSLNFKADSVAVLHTFIKNKEQLNKDLELLYNSIKNSSNNSIKDLKKQIGLLTGEIKFKDKIIDSLKINEPNIAFSDSLVKIPIVYSSTDLGLKLDGVAVANLIDKNGYVFWNRIETKLPKLRIGLVYSPTDTTITALIQSDKVIETFHTAMSDELYRLIVDNALPQETWLDRIGILTEFEYINKPFVNMQIYCYYRRFYLTIGKRFDIFNKFGNENNYRIGYKMSFNEIKGLIK